jgi:two-component system, OmpR family, KDP operon response regulator KdpE
VEGIILSKKKILIVDDSHDDLLLFTQLFQQEGFEVFQTDNGKDALRKAYDTHPDVILLDLDLGDPEMTGYRVCERLREVSQVPIVIVTGDASPDNTIKALDAGADDYVVKPIDRTDVLLARVRANIRRAEQQPLYERQNYAYNDGFLMIDLEDRRVIRNDEPVKLSPIEFNLLAILIRNMPKIVRYEDLLTQVWGEAYSNDIDYLRVYIWHLRQKLEPNAKRPTYIVNEMGIGYRFEEKRRVSS